ncbi:MAG: UvrD-helicase domain-containing protein [Bacilli bacterium]|nr:UvrD-helicase domain-containing protein [Bacilli bacterium]
MNELEIERKKFTQTKDIIEAILSDERMDLDKLYTEFIGSREDLWKITDRKKIHIHNLEESLEKPYFARIDFTYKDSGKQSTVYIGKNGVMKNTDIIVTDWRAPISSLYYDGEIGECSFEGPEETISGTMSLKRQYEIENEELLDYFDVELVSNDALLQKYLNSNNDARLKSIVSTIQKEQNAVIRRKISDNLIVQGVAGSGKTTVALHRIAYLVYNYINNIRQDQYLVIGPNPVFIKYIKSVLPDLDVSGVEQSTFEEYAKNYIGEEIDIKSSEKKANDNILGKIDNDIDKFKSSAKYKEMLDQFLNVYFMSLTANDLMIGDFKILDKSIIKETFESITLYTNSSLSNRVESAINRLCKIIENDYNRIYREFINYSYDTTNSDIAAEDKERRKKNIEKIRAELDKNFRPSIRKYFSKSKVDVTKLYKLFLTTIKDYDLYNYDHLDLLKKLTLDNIKNKTFDFEDLPALMYIKKRLVQNKENERIRHVVVDEAQDLGEFNFLVLKEILPSATFSIFGDLAQSIYDYRGVDNWESVNETMFDNKGEIVEFAKSYRTTAEIMNVADDVADSIGLGRSDMVVRHGNNVVITEIEDSDNIPDYIAEKIEEYKQKGYKTIAVISKTNLLSNYINDDLMDREIYIPNVSVNDDLLEERFRICTISNQLAKGLEFDAVIINNANEQIYSSENKLDMKLLYVAITRALHELDIVYSGTLTKPLHDSLEKENGPILKRIK